MTTKEFNKLFHGVACPKYRGAAYPKFDPAAINESKFSDALRFKDFNTDFMCDPDGEISTVEIDWMSQDWDENGIDGFKAEIERCFRHIGYLGNVEIHVYDRDGFEDKTIEFVIG